MCRLFMEREKKMNNHLLLKEIEEFLLNPTRVNRYFFSNRWLELHLGSNPTERYTRERYLMHKGFALSFDSSGLDQKQFLNEEATNTPKAQSSPYHEGKSNSIPQRQVKLHTTRAGPTPYHKGRSNSIPLGQAMLSRSGEINPASTPLSRLSESSLAQARIPEKSWETL
ncbi:hypothetical protein Lal_00033644 [Lupinus albus]|nr:hypothetical protein Lal_00033644 [Lupinus albus]